MQIMKFVSSTVLASVDIYRASSSELSKEIASLPEQGCQ